MCLDAPGPKWVNPRFVLGYVWFFVFGHSRFPNSELLRPDVWDVGYTVADAGGPLGET